MLGNASAQYPQQPSLPSAAAYQAALLAEASSFRDTLLKLSQCYAQHKDQPSAWSCVLHSGLCFLQKHAAAPVLGGYCQRFLRTVLLLCWFHVKQAWD